MGRHGGDYDDVSRDLGHSTLGSISPEGTGTGKEGACSDGQREVSEDPDLM